MVNVAGDEAAEIVGVFARAAATAFVQQEPDAVDILKQAGTLSWSRIGRERKSFDLLCLSFAIELRQCGDLTAVELGRSETQFFFESLLEDLYVLVLTKDEWNDEPIVPRADLPVGAAVSLKSLALAAGDVGR